MRNHPELTRLSHRLREHAENHYGIVAATRAETAGVEDSLVRDIRLRLLEDLQRSLRALTAANAGYERALRHLNEMSVAAGRVPAPKCVNDGCEKLRESFDRADGSIGYYRSGLCAGCRSARRRAEGLLV
jgi:hypothetical protein